MEHPLTTARRSAELTQGELAKLAGINRISIVRIEKGKQFPSPKTIVKIRDALKQKGINMSADDLLSAFDGAAA